METADVQALVVMSFGGPERMPEVLPFLERVVAGRGVPAERLAAVAEQYRGFGGVSPLPAQNRHLVAALRVAAPSAWLGDRVFLANRNTAPFPADVLGELDRLGVRRAAVFVTSAFSSYSGCRQYRENLAAGLAASGAVIDLLLLPRFHDHPILRRIWADRVRQAALDERTRLIFVTHSLPVSQAAGFVPGVTGYLRQHEALAASVAADAGAPDWRLAFQSRSGPPRQPWLEPDIGAAIEQAADEGCARVLVAPIGFCADNLEIRWDLDTVAAGVAARRGVAFERLDPPQSDPRFPDLVWDLFAAADGTGCQAGCCPSPKGPAPAVGERSDPVTVAGRDSAHDRH